MKKKLKGRRSTESENARAQSNTRRGDITKEIPLRTRSETGVHNKVIFDYFLFCLFISLRIYTYYSMQEVSIQ